MHLLFRIVLRHPHHLGCFDFRTLRLAQSLNVISDAQIPESNFVIILFELGLGDNHLEGSGRLWDEGTRSARATASSATASTAASSATSTTSATSWTSGAH